MHLLDINLDDEQNFNYLLKTIDIFELNCLELAVNGKHQKFVAHTLIQSLLTEVWHGQLSAKSDFKAIIKVR